MTDDRKRDVWIVSVIALIVVCMFVLERLTGCGKQNPTPAPAPSGPVDPGGNPPAVTCDGGLTYGQTKVVACVGGSSLYTCTEKGLLLTSSTCQGAGGGTGGGTGGTGGGGGTGGQGGGTPPACDKPSYAKVQPVLSGKCAGACHSFQTSYDAAKGHAAEIKRRANLPPGSADHMPLTGSPELTPDELGTLNTWLDAGAPNQPDCNQGGTAGGGGTQAAVDFPAVEAAVKADLSSSGKSRDDQLNSRYLVTANRQQDGSPPAVVQTLVRAMDKTMNSVNETGQSLFQVVPIDAARSVWRIDLRNFNISAAKWRAIEAADRLKIISQTNDGAVIRALTGTNEPIFMAENFIDVTQRAKGVYYTLLGIPPKLSDYQKKVGVNFAQDLRDLEVNFIGSSASVIAEQKNRLIVMAKANGNGQDRNSYAQTFDVIEVGGALQRRNLANFPLIAGTGGGGGTTAAVHTLQFDASETIVNSPSGVQQYALWDSAGNRVDFANPQIVTDTETPVGDKTIVNAASCHRCHHAGLIPMVDQIKAAVAANGSSLNANDVQLVDTVYGDATANSALFGANSALHCQAMTKIGISCADPDPINAATDLFLLNQTLQQTAAFVLLKPDQLRQCIQTSDKAKAIAGQLLSDSATNHPTITHNQVLDLFPVLITDCRLFQDPLNQQ